MPRLSGTRPRGALGRVAESPENMDSSSPSTLGESAQATRSPRIAEQQPLDPATQLQGQLIKTLQDALDEMRTMHRMSEEASQRECGQLQGRIHELIQREERRVIEVEELKGEIVELESKLFGGQQTGAAGRGAPLSTEIHLDPLPAYPTDASSDLQDWFIHLETKGDFPSRDDAWKVKALLKYLSDQYHAELQPLLTESGPRYERMRDHLILQHPSYKGYPLGYYKRKLDDLKAMWVSPAQMRGYLLELRNLQRKMCEKLNIPNAVWDEETLRSAYLDALPARMTHLVVACGDFTRLTLEQLL